MPTTRTTQNIDAVNFKEQSADPAAPGAGFGHIFRTATGWQERIAANAATLLMAGAFPCDGRLTLTSGTPITTSNVTGAGTIYFTPFRGNRIALYDGTRWRLYAFTEKSAALSGHTTNVPVDVFIYDNAGTLTLELVNWTNGTTRATALTTQDGVYVKSGATTRRYLGTFCPTAAATTEDSDSRRFVWNYYNRIPRYLSAVETTNSWNYTTATWRQTNNVTTVGATRVEIVIGVAEDLIEAGTHMAQVYNSGANVGAGQGIGIDSTSTNSAQVFGGVALTAGGQSTGCQYRGYPGIGYHYLQWLERSGAAGTTTWVGDNGGAEQQSGMWAVVMA
jgi:hypothetical protein